MRKSGKFLLQILLSLAVSGLFVLFSLRHTDLKAVAVAMAAADSAPIIGYLAILILVHLVKTVRWGLLLRPLGKISFRRLNAASAVGFMLTVILPLRLGELARPLLVAGPSTGDEARLPRSGALASCLVERVVDSVAVGALGIISLRFLAPSGRAAKLVADGALVLTAVFFGLCVWLMIAVLRREQAVKLLRAAVGRFSPPLAERVAKVADTFVAGLHVGSGRDMAAFFLLTVLYWSLHICGFWLVAGAFGFALSPLAATTVLACQVVGIMIPAGPGMVGTSQFFVQMGLSIFIPATITEPALAARAAGYANTIWLLQFGQTVVTGLVFLAAGHVSLRGLLRRWGGDPLGLRQDPEKISLLPSDPPGA